jgi:hypothetical protein
LRARTRRTPSFFVRHFSQAEKEENRIDRCTTALSVSSARSGFLRDLLAPARRRKAPCAAFADSAISRKN